MRPRRVNVHAIPPLLCDFRRPRERVGRRTFRALNGGKPDSAQIWFAFARARSAASGGWLAGDQFHVFLAAVAERVELGVAQMNVELDRLPRLHLDVFLVER